MWSINGVSLTELLGPLFIVRGTTWRPDHSTVRSPVSIGGRHGTIGSGLPVLGEPKVLLQVHAHAQASQSDLQAAVDKALALWVAPAHILGRRMAGGSEVFAAAEPESISHDGFVTGRADTMTLGFAIPGVSFRAPADAGTPLAFSANLTNALLPHLQGSSAPITDAVVRLKGPHTGAVSITDAATGTGLSQSPVSLSSSQYLYMDAGRLRSWFSANASAWAGGGTDASANLDYPGPGPLQLWPVVEPAVGDASFAAASEPRVRISATGGTGRTGDTTLAVYAGRSFL